MTAMFILGVILSVIAKYHLALPTTSTRQAGFLTSAVIMRQLDEVLPTLHR